MPWWGWLLTSIFIFLPTLALILRFIIVLILTHRED